MTHALALPPGFLKLLAHDLRWQIVQLLLGGDYRVQELVQQVGEPMNLVSYHLKHLREQDVVLARRSDADGRDVYYTLNREHLHSLYREAGEALSLTEEMPREAELAHPAKILFLCTGNSARSQIAEGLLRHLSKGQVEVFSAGSQPNKIHPLAIQAMNAFGIALEGQSSKHYDQFLHQEFDYVITVCDKIREVCPYFEGEHIHWSIPHPETYEDFQNVARQLRTRIQYLLLTLAHKSAL